LLNVSEAVVESPYVQETVVEMGVENEYNAQELAFPKLDGVLFPLVVANAEVTAPCAWMGGMEVSLTAALNNYYQPMTEENADQVITDVYDFLANQASKEEQVQPEPEVEAPREEKTELVVVEVKKESPPQSIPEKPPQKAEPVTEKEAASQQQPVEAPVEQTAVQPVEMSAEKSNKKLEDTAQTKPGRANKIDASVVESEPPRTLPETQNVEPEYEHVDSDVPALQSVEVIPRVENDILAPIQPSDRELVTEPSAPIISTTLEMDYQGDSTPDRQDTELPLHENSDVDLEVLEPEDEIVLEPLEYFDELLAEVGGEDNEEELQSANSEQEETPERWGTRELETVLDENTTSFDALIETELAITKANELLLLLDEPLETYEDIQFETDDSQPQYNNDEVPDELEVVQTESFADVAFIYEYESELSDTAAVRGYSTSLLDDETSVVKKLEEEDELTIRRSGSRGTTRTLTSAAGTIRTALHRAAAIGRSALRPHVIVSVR